MRIVKKAKIKEKLLNLDLPRDKNGEVLIDEKEYGVMLILEAVEGAPDAEKEIFELLASVAGVEVEKIENDEFELLPEIIEHLKKQDKLVTFLKQAFKSV